MTIEKQVAEIADCKWLDPEVYFQQEFFRKSGVYCKMNDMIRQAVDTGSFPSEEDLETGKEVDISNNEQSEAGVKVTSLVSEKLPIGFRPGFNSLYYIRTET